MATLTTLIAAALARLGLEESTDRSWTPRSLHVKTSLEALRADDIARAIAELDRAWQDEPGEDARVAREVILMRLDADLQGIDMREAVARKMRDAAEGAITVLDLRLQRLRFHYRPGQAWIAAGAAVLVAASTILSVLRFNLRLGLAAAGLVAFGAAAILLVAVDRSRQREAFEIDRAGIAAEVAEEIQILRAEIRSREAELLAARSDRDRTLAIRDDLPRDDLPRDR